MVNISKQRLDQKTQSKLFLQLACLFTAINQQTANNFIGELFTDAEKIMVMKRLAIILMLSKKCTRYRIAQSLKVSETTVNVTKRRYDVGSYNAIVRATKRDSFDSKKFWHTVEVLVRGGMPSMGKDRWKGFGF